MATFGAGIAKVANKLIGKFGTAIVYTHVSVSGYNTSTGINTTNTSSENLFAVIDEYADSLRFLGDKLEKGSTIITGDKKMTIAASSFSITPVAGDTVTVGAATYVVQGVASAFAADQIAYYALHMRKA